MRSPGQRRRKHDERPAKESPASAARCRRRHLRAMLPTSRRTKSRFQGCWSICFRRFLEKPFNQRAVDGRIPIRCAAEFLPDYTIAADDHGLGIAVCIVQPAHITSLTALIVKNLEREPQALHELPDLLIRSRIIDADGDDLEA